MIKISPSSVPLREKCPASGADPEIEIDEVGVPATIGRAVHEICADMVMNKSNAIIDVEPYAIDNGIPEQVTELSVLTAYARQAWFGDGNLSAYFSKPECEKRMLLKDKTHGEQVRLSGKVDVVSIDNNVCILDWKTGRKQSDYIGQLKSYGLLALRENPKAKEVTLVIVWLRDQSYSVFKYSRKEIEDWWADFLRYSAISDGAKFSPGDHCVFCPRRLECPGRSHALVKIAEIVRCEEELTELTPEQELEAYHLANDLKKECERYRKLYKQKVKIKGGIQAGDTRVFIDKKKGRRSIEPTLAWSTLKEYLPEVEITKAVKFGIGKLKDIVAESAPSGQKKHLINEVMEALDEAGAIKVGKRSEYLKEENSES